MLNTYYKILDLKKKYIILTKLLSKRLQILIPSIVSSDQTSYIKNRFIGENIRTISDLIQFANLKQRQGIIIQLDFEKSFDSISWNFLHKTFKKFNFGPKFSNWIKILYNNPQCCVITNGYHSEILISSGARHHFL